jgi:hypothetical protein
MRLSLLTPDGMKYWHKSSASNNVNPSFFVPPYGQARSVDIEMTSYGLLVYVRRQDAIGGLPIAKWIAAQRNANGGFSSTQVNGYLY